MPIGVCRLYIVMSFKAIFELAVQIESFRNIDLLHQGVYFLRISLHHLDKGRKRLACPYHLHSAEILRKRKQTDVHNLQPAALQPTFNAFVTKAFMIRYCEEEVELNDVAYFRTEVPVEDLETWNLIFEAELMFSDLGGNLTSESVQEEMSKKPEFGVVSSATFTLTAPTNGLHEYVPVLFDESHFCVANATIHCALVDFRHRITADLSASVGKKGLQQSTDASIRLSQYLFKDPQGAAKSFVGAEETDQIYTRFVNRLASNYDTLRGLFIVYSSKCLTEGERETSGVCYAPPQLSLPGNPAQSPYSKGKLGIDSVNLSIAGPGFEGEDAPELSISSISPDIEDERPRGVLRFSERVASHDPAKVASTLLLEINLIGGQMMMLWHRVIELVKGYPRPVTILLQERFYDRVRDKFSHSVVKNIIKIRDFTVTADHNIKETHEAAAAVLRKELLRQPPRRLPVEDSIMLASADVQPVIFEDVLIRERESEANLLPQVSVTTDESYEIWDTSFTKMDWSVGLKMNRGVHLFVLVHGFQGNSFDMRLLKNHFSLLHPEALFLCSNSNEETTEGDIGEMGVRLAQEVTAYITQWCDKNRLGRISFIGHSMGGLIIRAALPYLEALAGKMHLFLTLSTPHLGYMYNSSKIIDAGMWFLKTWRKSKCLQQLSMTDNKPLRQCLVYELSTKKGLGWFKHVVLISSSQDQYAPFDSARMEISTIAAKDPTRGGIYQEMAGNLLASLNTDTLFRIDINFRITEKSLDTFIGRAAHIQFLESQTLMKMILLRYPEFFT